MESTIDTIHTNISKFPRRVTEEGLSNLEEKLL
jgi:hypothetical protein